MVQRVVYGALAITVLGFVFLLDILIAKDAADLEGPLGDLLRRGSVFPLALVVLMSVAGLELARLLRAAGARPYARFAHAMIAAMVLAPWLSAAGWLGSGVAQVEGLFWQVILLMASGVGCMTLAVARGTPKRCVADTGATLTMILLLGFLASFCLQLRCGRDVSGQDGAWLLLIVLVVTKASDIGAYFAGTLFGRHKLAPAISPGKSVEGAIAGLAASGLLAATVVVAAWSAPAESLLAEATHAFALSMVDGGLSPLWRAVILGVVLSACGQVGDLFESCFKRDAGLKDSGQVIPTFGGVLDLVDSPLIAVPVAWVLLTWVWNVV